MFMNQKALTWFRNYDTAFYETTPTPMRAGTSRTRAGIARVARMGACERRRAFEGDAHRRATSGERRGLSCARPTADDSRRDDRPTDRPTDARATLDAG